MTLDPGAAQVGKAHPFKKGEPEAVPQPACEFPPVWQDGLAAHPHDLGGEHTPQSKHAG
jgi:hypothetical protein